MVTATKKFNAGKFSRKGSLNNYTDRKDSSPISERPKIRLDI